MVQATIVRSTLIFFYINQIHILIRTHYSLAHYLNPKRWQEKTSLKNLYDAWSKSHSEKQEVCKSIVKNVYHHTQSSAFESFLLFGPTGIGCPVVPNSPGVNWYQWFGKHAHSRTRNYRHAVNIGDPLHKKIRCCFAADRDTTRHMPKIRHLCKHDKIMRP